MTRYILLSHMWKGSTNVGNDRCTFLRWNYLTLIANGSPRKLPHQNTFLRTVQAQLVRNEIWTMKLSKLTHSVTPLLPGWVIWTSFVEPCVQKSKTISLDWYGLFGVLAAHLLYSNQGWKSSLLGLKLLQCTTETVRVRQALHQIV